MNRGKKLICFFVIFTMTAVSWPGEAMAATAEGAWVLASNSLNVNENVKNWDNQVDVANLESQLLALEELEEQQDLIEKSFELENPEEQRPAGSNDLSNPENSEEQKPAGPNDLSNPENPEGQKPAGSNDLSNPENPEEQKPAGPNEEKPQDPNDPEVLKWKIGSIDKIPMQLFDKNAEDGIKPELVVRDGNGEPMTHQFYDAVWENNKSVGLAKVTVTGKNGCEGTASQEFYIVESFTPGKLEISKVETDLGRAKIYFDPISIGDMKIRYEVRCKKVGDIYDESFNFQEVKDSVIVKGLEHNKKYEFRVKAYYFNEEGNFVDGPLSDKVVKWTNRLGDRKQDLEKAEFLDAVLGKNSVKFNIKKVELRDEPELEIGYRIIFGIKGYSKYRHVDTTDLTKTFYNLDRGVNYRFKVKYYYISKLDGTRVYSESSLVKNIRLSLHVDKVLNIARSWLGRNEKRGTHKYIIDIYNRHRPLARGYKVKYTDEWCATTVSAVFIKAKAVSLPGGTECSVQHYINKYKRRGVWEEDGRIRPKPGYIICYNWDDRSQAGGNNGWADHIGIVEKVRGNKITVIEGNYGRKVGRRVIPVGWGYIRGYAKLNYATNSTIWNTRN